MIDFVLEIIGVPCHPDSLYQGYTDPQLYRQDILNAPPTDGLWGDDRTDEDQIGASYPELEWAMEMSALGKKEADFSGREKEVFLIYQRFHNANKHKMLPI
ncbi:MAG: hypothetical protein RQ760_20720, partial [Sedimentisphaerales bacterium]|nr:hypothetical protein [Sedimentisphaerales bacterium]